MLRVLVFPFALLFALGGLMVWQVAGLLQLQAWVEHSGEILRHANAAYRIWVDEESALRGYLLTGDEAFLAAYRAGQARAAPLLAGLSALVAEDRAQAGAVRELLEEHAIRANRGEAQIRARARAGWRPSVADALDRERQLDRLRGKTDAFLDAEREIRRARVAAVARQTRRSLASGVIAFALAAAALAAGAKRRIQAAHERFSKAARAESHLLSLWESNLLGVMYADARGNLADANDAFLRMVGYRREDLREGRVRWQDMTPPGDEELDAQGLREAAALGACTPYEKVCIGKDGRRVPILLGYTTIEGNRDRYLCFALDLTERCQAEEDAKRSRDGLRRLAEASRKVIERTDLHGVLQCVAEAALALTGARHSVCGHGAEGKPMCLGGAARAPGVPACPPGEMFSLKRGGVLQDLLDGAEAVRLDDAALRAHPRWRGLPPEHPRLRGLLAVPLRARDDRVCGMVLVTDKEDGGFNAEDESLLKQLGTMASLALQHVEARLSLEEADRRKDDFLAVLSHELRNPLAPIKNSLHVLDRVAPANDATRRARVVIEHQVEHMTRLIADLLDVSRISRGKIEISRARVDLDAVVRRTVEDHQGVFAARSISLAVSTPPHPVRVVGDPVRLAQMLGNLLHNAAKFTAARGRVEVRLDDQGLEATLRVRDDGVGIAPEALAAIFEPFTQGKQALDRASGGLGLGLALVRGLAQMHGGRVEARSDGLGHGAEITLHLPLDTAPTPTAAPREPAAKAVVRRVLIIEDNIDAAESLKEALALDAHHVEVAYDGPTGLEKARECAPEVVLCDIGLPGMDGYEVARAFRADAALRESSLVALTGYALAEDRQRALDAGFDGHLAKPPDLGALERLMAELPTRRAA
jgi:PAS domain S-box-containing protein